MLEFYHKVRIIWRTDNRAGVTFWKTYRGALALGLSHIGSYKHKTTYTRLTRGGAAYELGLVGVRLHQRGIKVVGLLAQPPRESRVDLLGRRPRERPGRRVDDLPRRAARGARRNSRLRDAVAVLELETRVAEIDQEVHGALVLDHDVAGAGRWVDREALDARAVKALNIDLEDRREAVLADECDARCRGDADLGAAPEPTALRRDAGVQRRDLAIAAPRDTENGWLGRRARDDGAPDDDERCFIGRAAESRGGRSGARDRRVRLDRQDAPASREEKPRVLATGKSHVKDECRRPHRPRRTVHVAALLDPNPRGLAAGPSERPAPRVEAIA